MQPTTRCPRPTLVRRILFQRPSLRCAAAALAVAVITPWASAQHAPFREGEVIVRFRADVPDAERTECLAMFGLAREQTYERLRCELARSTVADIEPLIASLRRDPRVEHAQPNFIYTAFASAPQIAPQDPFLGPTSTMHTYGPLLTRLPSLWRSSSGGNGITIAILDTGVDLTHPEFAGRLLPGYDFVNVDAVPADDDGHGTHVAGIAAAAMDTAGCVGVAPLATILPVKVLAAGGSGTTIWIGQGLDYAAANGAKVINLSLGIGVDDCVVREAIAAAYASGCTIVAASGNGGGGGTLAYPAEYEEVIAVGAVDSSGAVTSFSQYGSHLDVVAPGDLIVSCKRGGGYIGNLPTDPVGTGTSMAAPFVSGIAALVLGDFPGIKPWEVEVFLREHARNTDAFTAGQAGNQDGYGMVCFGSLRDYSNGNLVAAWSDNSFFEWLGADVTGESSMNDNLAVPQTVGSNDLDDWQPDLDGATNLSGEDGGDDGLFPGSHGLLPLVPVHIATAMGVVQPLGISMSVGNSSGPRYSAGQQLKAQVWTDFDSSSSFSPAERMVNANSSPNGWGGNSLSIAPLITPPNDHYRGNPMRFRTRLDYVPAYVPPGVPPGPTGAQLFGEVEDSQVLNFFEDFDSPDFHNGVYATLEPSTQYPDVGGWAVTTDPANVGGPMHWGQWHFATVDMVPCTGITVDKRLFVPDQVLDLRELTHAWMRLWAMHAVCAQCPYTDSCRLSVLYSSSSTGPFTEVPIYDFPDPDFCTGQPVWSQLLTRDLSAYCGYFVQLVVHHNTQKEDQLAIDDVAIYGYDDRAPQAPILTSTTTPLRSSTVNWNHPDENNPPINIAGLPKNGALYAARLALAGGVFDWVNGFRLTPRDFANASSALPPIGAAGAATSAIVRVPTTFPNLALALSEKDEVENLGAVGTTTLSVTPTFMVDVLAPAGPLTAVPGQTLSVDFIVTNLGNALDAQTILVTDSQATDWVECPLERTRVLAPLAGAIETVIVTVPVNVLAGASDTVTVKATSLSDPNAFDSDTLVINVVGGGNPCVGTPFCFGDGSGTPCPCGNVGLAGRGCSNSALSGGALLCATGTPSISADTFVLQGSDMPPAVTALYFQGTAQVFGGAGVAFNDGLRCVGGVITRLGIKTNAGGVSAFGAPLGDPAISVKGGVVAAGTIIHYQIWYRDPPPSGPCGTSANLSNALSVTWLP